MRPRAFIRLRYVEVIGKVRSIFPSFGWVCPMVSELSVGFFVVKFIAINGEVTSAFGTDVLLTASKLASVLPSFAVALFVITVDTWSILLVTPAAANRLLASLNNGMSGL